MGKRVARPVVEYGSMAEFHADGGPSAYGEGFVVIAGQSYRSSSARLYDPSGAAVYDGNMPASQHLVGHWPLDTQNYTVCRDVSGKRNHWVTNGYAGSSFVGLNNGAGWLEAVASNYVPGRLCASPLDTRYDITGPGQSFIIAFEHRRTTNPAAQDMVILGKGGPAGAGGKRTLAFGMSDNGASVRCRVIDNNSNVYSANIPGWEVGKITPVLLCRDSTVNKLFVYFGAALDAGFNTGAGFLTFNPTVQHAGYNLSLAGYGTNTNNAAGGDASATNVVNGHQFRNLQLYVTPPGVGVANHADLAKILANNPAHILTASELP